LPDGGEPLRNVGYEVIEAENGQNGLKFALKIGY
jgi:hypothetical protein